MPDPTPTAHSKITTECSHETDGQDHAAIERRFIAGSARMDRIESMVIASKADIEEVLEIIRLGKSFFKVIGYLGSFIKWASPVAASCAAFYYALRGQK